MLKTLNLRDRVRGHAERDGQLGFGIMHEQVRVGEIE